METIYQTWTETTSLFERRGFPKDSYENLDEEEYILHPGPATLTASLWLDDHQYRHQNPWIDAGGRPEYAGVDGAVTGYVVDGDLTVEGNVVNLDFGSPALVVLGSLKAANLVVSGSSRLLVQGGLEVETLIATSTDSYIEVLGDLRATVTVLWDEFTPTVGGDLATRLVAPVYLNPEDHELTVADPAPDAPLSDLLVPEVLVAAGESAGDDEYLAEAGLRYTTLLDRIIGGLPVVRGGRTVAALEELPPV